MPTETGRSTRARAPGAAREPGPRRPEMVTQAGRPRGRITPLSFVRAPAAARSRAVAIEEALGAAETEVVTTEFPFLLSGTTGAPPRHESGDPALGLSFFGFYGVKTGVDDKRRK